MNRKKVLISLFVCLFLFASFTNQAGAYQRFYYFGKLNGGVYARTWGITQKTYTLHGRTVNYYDRVLSAVSNWNGINPTSNSNVDVSLSYKSDYTSATLRFYVDAYGDNGWAASCDHYTSNGTYINPRSTSGNWDHAKLFLNAYYTNYSTYTSSMITAAAAHEIGHAFGFEDLYGSNDDKLMWWNGDTRTVCGITSDEVTGIRTIY